MKNILLLFTLALLSLTTCFSQVKYGIKIYSGLSDLRVIDKDPSLRFSGNYKALPLYGTGIFITEKLKNSRYSFEQGIDFESLSSEYNLTDKFIGYMHEDYPDSTFDTSWDNRHCLINIPLTIKYEIKNWLKIIAGLDNILYLGKKNYETNQLYALRGRLGMEATIRKRLLIGLNFTSDISPSGIDPASDKICFKYYTTSISLGILLSKN